MDNNFFFSKAKMQSGFLDRWYQYYNLYFGESLWLLIQKFHSQLLKNHGWVELKQLESAWRRQIKLFLSGAKISIGEILLNKGNLSEEKVSLLMREMGLPVLFCSTCRLYLQKKTFLEEKEHNCPQCNSLLTFASLLPAVDALRSNLTSPRLSSQESVSEQSFMFLELSEYLDKGPDELEQEIAVIMQGCEYWLTTLARGQTDSNKKQNTDSKDPLAVTSAINKRLMNIKNKPSMEDNSRDKTPDISAAVPLLWGYLHNLHELFWILRQQIFSRIAQDKGYCDEQQAAEGINMQKRALENGKLMHCGQAFLQSYIVDEQQVAEILALMGERALVCQSCQLAWFDISGYRTPYCPRCRTQNPNPGSLEQLMNYPIFPILAVNLQSSEPEFEFFRAGENHIPGFSLGNQIINSQCKLLERELEEVENQAQALDAPQKKSAQSKQENPKTTEEKKEGKTSLSATIQEIKRLLQEEDQEEKEDDPLMSSAELGVTWIEIKDFVKTMENNDIHTDDLLYDFGENKQETKKRKKKKARKIDSEKSPYRVPKTDQLRVVKPTDVFNQMLHEKKTSHLWLMLTAILLAGIIVLAALLYRNQQNRIKRNSSHAEVKKPEKKKESKETTEVIEDIETTEENTEPEAEQENNSENGETTEPEKEEPKEPKTAKSSALQKLLNDGSSPMDIAFKVMQLANQKTMSQADIATLIELYQRYSGYDSIRNAVIYGINAIGGQEARQWLESIARNSVHRRDRVTAITSLEKSGDQQSQSVLLQIFRDETDSEITIASAYVLSRITPNSQDVYRELHERFYQSAESKEQQNLLLAMANMNLQKSSDFFVEVLQSSQYNLTLRMRAIDAITIYSMNHKEQSSQILEKLQQFQLSGTGNQALAKKVKQAINFLEK